MDGEASPGDGPVTDSPEPGAPRRRIGVLCLAFVASVALGLLAHFTLERIFARDTVLRRVSMLGVPLGGLSGEPLRAAVRRLAPKVGSGSVTVSVKGRAFVAKATALGLELDADATVRAALAAGREGSLPNQLAFWAARLFVDRPLPAVTRLDPARAAAVLDSFERAALGEPASEGAVRYEAGVVAIYPHEGWALRKNDALRLVQDALSIARTRAEPLELPVEHVLPKLARADVDRARAEAERLLSGPVVLKSEAGKELSFGVEDLGHALESAFSASPRPTLVVSLGRAALGVVLERARPALEVPAKNASFAIGAHREVTVVPSELGTRLDDEAILSAATALAATSRRDGALALRTDVVPALTTEQANALGIHVFVSKYTTYFPCCEARVKNIERIAALVDGSIVRPGEQFSLNGVTGPRTTANGFVAGPTIVEGEMDLTIGGGVSQFATTLFNAAFDGGYEIIMRQPHTYWFPRYPEGYDATLGFPLPDLVFRNDSNAGLLVKAEVGPRSVTVSLYGGDEVRKVERHASARFDIVKPETDFEANPDLPPDEPKVKFGGMMGWSLNVSRVVTFADGHTKEERRKVTYSPRAREVETHPCKIPDGAPGYTGEPCPRPEPDGGAGK